MPVLSLPDDLMKAVETSQSGKIDGTEGSGVASYRASNGDVRLSVYLGLELGGETVYRNNVDPSMKTQFALQNINSVDASIKMQFALQPVVTCQADVLTFNPTEQYDIAIQVVLGCY